ncbi:MAG TPA: DUF4221 family protein [Saprospiraceae bacterium]|nr:DUF4221 family protein [Saprospiraceae bacterium]HMP23263.1 DUF4221 family protein [Saprospiraceae bacterium]
MLLRRVISIPVLLFTLIAILSLLSGCQRDETDGRYEAKNAKQYERKHTLVASTDILLPIDSVTSFDYSDIQYFTNNDTAYLALFNPNIPALDVYNFAERSKLKRIYFALEGPDGVGNNTNNMGCFVYAPDTIIIHNYWSDKLFFLHANAKKIASIDMVPPDSLFFSAFFTQAIPFRVGNEVFFPNLYQGIKKGQLIPSQKIPVFQVTNVEKQTIRFVGKRSSVYDKDYHVAGTNSGVLGDYNPHTQKVIYSFKQDHFIYTNDINGSNVTKRYVASEFFEQIPPLSTSFEQGLEMQRNNREKVREYVLTAPNYSIIKYDPWREVYYRFAYLPRTLEDYQGRAYRLRPSIIIMDKNFNKTGEVKIDPDGYFNTAKLIQSFVTPQGLCIPWKNRQSEDFLTLRVFTLQKVNDSDS